MASEIVGRKQELEQLHAFVEATPLDGARALVLKGEAGIGKSTIWLRGLALAGERGLRVLSSRPVEAEQALAFAGLGDLFEDCLDDVLPHLPPPRRRALEVALLVETAQGPLDPRAIGVAVRSGLELLAEAQPLLLAIDDVQWLDRASFDALVFALRRMSVPLHLLFARRDDERASHSEFEQALRADAVETLPLGRLSVGAVQTLLRERLARVFARPTLLRIHETAGGNPFYALEIARALPPDFDPSQPLPVPRSFDRLLWRRFAALPKATREGLALIAAIGTAPVDVLRNADVPDDVLAPAFDAQIIGREDDEIRFAHPLLASAVYLGITNSERRAAHRRLGRVLVDPIASARHLALAADRPDAQAAAALDDAATIASVRSVPIVAGELGELARRLTPDEDTEGRHRRAIMAASAHLRAGDTLRARLLAELTLAAAADGRARAEALVLLSGVEARTGNSGEAIARRREALREASASPALVAAVHQWLAANVSYSEGALVREWHARTSLELAERLQDDTLRAGALAVLANLRFDAGEPDAVALAEQAHELAGAVASRGEQRTSSTQLAHVLAWSYDRLDLLPSFSYAEKLISIGRFDTARALLDRLERQVAQRDELLESTILWLGSVLEVQAGHWSLALDYMEREREITELYGDAIWVGPVVVLAELAVHRGELDRARELAACGRPLGEREPSALAALEAIVGLADRADGDLEAAVAGFFAAEVVAKRCDFREPSVFWWRADLAETLLELGRVKEAVELLDAWEPDARRLGRDRIVAHVMRCRGLVAAARGEVDLALATLEQAVDLVDSLEDPFGRARALLALGVTRRRARQGRGAREAIEAALAGFAQLGEVTWTKRAQGELGRIGGRTRAEGLTPAERRVAALVAEGRTNREVAAALFLGERTVETHLTRIYSKLGVRSRTELARVYEPTS